MGTIVSILFLRGIKDLHFMFCVSHQLCFQIYTHELIGAERDWQSFLIHT